MMLDEHRGNKYIYLKSCYCSCSTCKCIIKGHLGRGGCAGQQGVTIAAHQHSARRDAETQIFLSKQTEHKRNSWMDFVLQKQRRKSWTHASQ